MLRSLRYAEVSINAKLSVKETGLTSFQKRATDINQLALEDASQKEYSEGFKALQPDSLYYLKFEITVLPEAFDKIKIDLNDIKLDYSPINQQ